MTRPRAPARTGPDFRLLKSKARFDPHLDCLRTRSLSATKIASDQPHLGHWAKCASSHAGACAKHCSYDCVSWRASCIDLMSKKARDKWQNSASFSRNGDLHVAKKTTNRPGFAHEPSRFGFLANVYCPRSPAGVSFPKLALFFVPGDQNAAARRLRVDDRRFANRPRRDSREAMFYLDLRFNHSS